MESLKGFYVSLKDKPYKLVIHKSVSYSKDVYEVYNLRNKIDALRRAVEVLYNREEEYLDKFEKLDRKEYMKNSGRKRRFISKEKKGLYPKSPHLTEDHSFEQNGYWIATNFGQGGIMRSLRRACKAGDLEFGHVMEIDM